MLDTLLYVANKVAKLRYLLGDDASFIPESPTMPLFFKVSTCFFTRPRRFSYLDVSIDAARLRTDFPTENMQKKKKLEFNKVEYTIQISILHTETHFRNAANTQSSLHSEINN